MKTQDFSQWSELVPFPVQIEQTELSMQRFAPDQFFTQAQYDRMQELMARKTSLTLEEDAELDALIDATVSRSDAFLPHLFS